MTTIAANREMMVADSKVVVETDHTDRMYSAPKLYRAKNGAILGGAGDNNFIESFFKWWGTKKKKPVFPKNSNFEALVLTPKGELLYYDETLSYDRIGESVYAIGSGGFAALGAMLAGVDPVRAVEIACKIDPNSGPPTQLMRLNEDTNSV